MFTVAVIGPDGAGKSTVIEGLQQRSPYPMRRIYMGVNPESLSHMLPTTRLVNYMKRRRKRNERPSTKPNEKNRGGSRQKKSIWITMKSFLFIANRFGETWYRQAVCWYYLHKGFIVLFDRHFYLDQLAFRLANPHHKRPFLRRAYDRVLEKTYPRPDLVIYLDAPAEVLFARKHESTMQALDQMREAYLKMEKFLPAFHVVDAVHSPESVLENVIHHIQVYQESLNHKSTKRVVHE